MSKDFTEGYLQGGNNKHKEIYICKYKEYEYVLSLSIFFQKLEEVKKVEDDLNEKEDEEVTEDSQEYEYYYDRK